MSSIRTNLGLVSFLDLNYAKDIMRFQLLFMGLCLAACQPPNQRSTNNIIPIPQTPSRIVSLDFCADQYVLKLIETERILALSPDAKKPISYLRNKAQNIQTVRPSAEDVLHLKPDLIIRSYGGGPNAEKFYNAAKIPVINIGWAGDFDSIKTVTQTVAEQLGKAQRGAAIIADMDKRLEALQNLNKDKAVLYMTPSGTTTGAGSLVHEIINTAGLNNFQMQSGWRDIPLERLAYEQPDLIAAAFFDTDTENAWSAMRHPIAQQQLQDRPTVNLKGSWISCGAWFAMDAVEALTGTP